MFCKKVEEPENGSVSSPGGSAVYTAYLECPEGPVRVNLNLKCDSGIRININMIIDYLSLQYSIV